MIGDEANNPMNTEQRRFRHLAWEGCLNVRELGGYPAMDGRETRWHAIVRADNLASLTEAGRAALVAYGIRSIIDLRRPHEVDQSPNPFAHGGPHGIAYANISFGDPAVAPPSRGSLADRYQRALVLFPHRIAAIMRAIAYVPEGGVVLHCNGGKDRTGMIAALLLDLVGVARATIAADYALSAECLRARDEAWLAQGPGERAERERQLAADRPRAEVMQAVLKYLDDRYGGRRGIYGRQAWHRKRSCACASGSCPQQAACECTSGSADKPEIVADGTSLIRA